MFIAKEPNAAGHNKTEDRSFAGEWNVASPPTYPFAQRLAEWAYGIINNFPPYEKLENKMQYLRRIAFVKMKKSGGGAFTDNKEMYRLVKPQCHLILEEVNIIKPDIIVACLSFAEHLLKIFSGRSVL